MLVGTKAYEVTLQFLLHLMQPQQGELRFFAGLAELIFQGFAELVAAKDGIITLSADLQHLCLKGLKPRGLLLAGGLSLLEGFGLGRRQMLVGSKAYEVTLQLLLHLMQLQQGELRFFAGLAELIFQGFAELVAAKDRLITLSADLQHLCLKGLKPRGLLLAGGLSLLEGFGLGRRQMLVGTKAYEVTLQILLHLMQLQQC
jgi:hypothetical protein